MVLVTGGTGFLGAQVIDQLLNLNTRVRATKRSHSRIPALLEDRVGLEWMEADVQDYFAMEEAFKDVSQVYHCAAHVSYDPSQAALMQEVNVEGTAHVVNLCVQHQARLVHVSSIAALGQHPEGDDTSEADLWEYDAGLSAYSVSKYESEMEVWRGFSEGLKGVIVNPSLIIGASAGNKGSGAIFHLLKKGLAYYPTGSVGLVDVQDVARAMIQLMARPDISGERYIVSHVNMTHRELLAQCSTYLNRPAPTRKATPTLLEIAWRGAKLIGWVRNRKPALTKESARISSKKLRFTNKKLVDALQFTFKPMEQTLKEICEQVQQEHQA